MGKSLKNIPIIKFGKYGSHSGKANKVIAARKLRRKMKNDFFEMNNYGEYRKHCYHYDILDMCRYVTYSEAVKNYELYSNPKSPEYRTWYKQQTKEQYLNNWKKRYLRK